MTKPAIILSYPPLAQLGEYLQAGAGLAFAAGPLLFLSLPRWVAATFLLLAALFLGHLLRTLARHMGRIELSEDCIRITGPFAASLRWDEMNHLALRYYPRSRDSKTGWMRLTIKGDTGRPLSFDSDLDGFGRLLGTALCTGATNGVAFSETTRANVAAIGQTVPDTVPDTVPLSGTLTDPRGTAAS